MLRLGGVCIRVNKKLKLSMKPHRELSCHSKLQSKNKESMKSFLN